MEQQKKVTYEQFAKVVDALTEITLDEVKARESQVAKLAIDLDKIKHQIELIEHFLGDDYAKLKEAQP